MRASRRGSGTSSSSNSASAPSASAIVIGPTNAMSVIAWRDTSAYSGDVAVTTAASTPARRLTKRDTHR